MTSPSREDLHKRAARGRRAGRRAASSRPTWTTPAAARSPTSTVASGSTSPPASRSPASATPPRGWSRRSGAQVERFTHTCFMVAPYESYVAVCEQLNALTPGRLREAVGAVQLRRRGGRERRQDRPARHRAAGGRGVRPRLPRPDQPDDGADREEHAVQAPVRAVRRGDLPGADVVPVARRRAAPARRRPRGPST